jgi:hemerythrin-like domain-containing protein
LKKHIFNEESNIFIIIIINYKDKVEVEQVKILLQEHRKIENIVDKIGEEIKKVKKPDTTALMKIIANHEKREVQILYPKIDERLSQEQVKEVLAYSNEIKIT